MRVFTKFILCIILIIVVVPVGGVLLSLIFNINANISAGVTISLAASGCIAISNAVDRAFKYEKPKRHATKSSFNYVRNASSNPNASNPNVVNNVSVAKKNLGIKYKNVFNEKVEVFGKVLHYSFSGNVKIVCYEEGINIFDKKSDEQKINIKFFNIVQIEIVNVLGNKVSIYLTTTTGEMTELIVAKDSPILNGILKLKENLA